MTLFENILITGVRFEIGQALCRILRKTGLADQVIGCDFSLDHPATLIFDDFRQCLPPDHPGYFDSIREIVEKHAVDLIIPMSEAEIYRFSDHGFSRWFEGIPVLTAGKQAIDVGRDKLATCQFLAASDLPHPWTQIAGAGTPPEVPCVLKMRNGSEGQHLVIVDHPELVPFLSKTRPSDIWQELLKPSEEEYTCGLFRSLSGKTRCISIRRKLQHGHTRAGQVIRNAAIDEYLSAIAQALNLAGSINIQLILTSEGPVAFEINPRFSSTVMFRHLLGFQDFVWTLEDLAGVSLGEYAKVPHGVRLFRGPREYILSS